METMDDFKDELEASFRQIREGDIITGTVIAVSEEECTGRSNLQQLEKSE